MGQAMDDLLARTPAEAKRHWMIDRLWSAHLFSCVLALVLVGMIFFGPWSRDTERTRLAWLGMMAVGALVLQGFTVLAFSLGGPVGRWKVRWGDRSIDGEDDEVAAYDQGPGSVPGKVE